MISFILGVLGFLIALYLIFVLIAGIVVLCKSIAVGVGFSLVSFFKGGQLLFSTWWAWLIQFPFVILYALFFYFEGWTAFLYVFILQFMVSFLIFNIQRIIDQKRSSRVS